MVHFNSAHLTTSRKNAPSLASVQVFQSLEEEGNKIIITLLNKSHKAVTESCKEDALHYEIV